MGEISDESQSEEVPSFVEESRCRRFRDDATADSSFAELPWTSSLSDTSIIVLIVILSIFTTCEHYGHVQYKYTGAEFKCLLFHRFYVTFCFVFYFKIKRA